MSHSKERMLGGGKATSIQSVLRILKNMQQYQLPAEDYDFFYNMCNAIDRNGEYHEEYFDSQSYQSAIQQLLEIYDAVFGPPQLPRTRKTRKNHKGRV